jgi:hypothetical protein
LHATFDILKCPIFLEISKLGFFKSFKFRNINETINVEIFLTMQQMMLLDEKREMVTIIGYATYKWKDRRLKWDKEKYQARIEMINTYHGQKLIRKFIL